MILNFTVKNFGSIKDEQTLSFEAEKSSHLEDFYISKIGKHRILKIALIYGANASGKTMILEALDFLRTLVVKPMYLKDAELNFYPFLFDKKTSRENTVLSIEFIQNKVRYFYEVEFSRKAIIKERLLFYNPNKAIVFRRTTDIENQFTRIKFGSKFKIKKTFLETLQANTLWNNTVLGGYLKTNVEINELQEVTEWFRNYLGKLIRPGDNLNTFITSLIYNEEIKKEDILAILRKADLNISDIELKEKEGRAIEAFLDLVAYGQYIPEIESEKIKTNLNLSFEHSVGGEKYILPFNLESEGTKRYYGLAGILSLLIKEKKAFPIDELESSLHPDLYEHFLLTFLANATESQIIATTHNREILDDKDFIRDDAIWIANKRKGATELYSLADFDTSVIRDTTNRLNAYKSGKLGGVPNLGDYYLN